MRAGYVGRMSAAVGKGSFAPNKLANMKLWLDGNDTSTITKAYQAITPTGLGVSGSNTITASAAMDNLAQIGNKIRIGATDIYTISAISTVTITTVETLTATYAALSALALDKESQVNDKSGNANTATQGTADLQPTFVPAIKNSKNAMGFDGVNDKLSVASSSTIDDIFGSGGTRIFVINPRDAGGSGNARICDKTRNTLIVSGFSANLGKITYNQSTSGTAGQWTSSSTIVPQNNYSIVIVTYNASSLATAPNIYVNSNAAAALTVDTSPTGAATSDATNAYILGNRAAGDRPFNGLILQALAYNRILTAVERAQINTYFSNFYNITVS